jgi:hypothetical protein
VEVGDIEKLVEEPGGDYVEIGEQMLLAERERLRVKRRLAAALADAQSDPDAARRAAELSIDLRNAMDVLEQLRTAREQARPGKRFPRAAS